MIIKAIRDPDYIANAAHIASTANPHSVDETDILPSQATHSGKFLATDGTDSSWAEGAAEVFELVDTLPAPTEGKAVFLTTNQRVYIARAK